MRARRRLRTAVALVAATLIACPASEVAPDAPRAEALRVVPHPLVPSGGAEHPTTRALGENAQCVELSRNLVDVLQEWAERVVVRERRRDRLPHAVAVLGVVLQRSSCSTLVPRYPDALGSRFRKPLVARHRRCLRVGTGRWLATSGDIVTGSPDINGWTQDSNTDWVEE